MKTIGLIGGMSYSSTISYYEQLNSITNNLYDDLTTPKIYLSSLNFKEIESLQHNNEWDKLGMILNDEAKKLEQIGVEILALCTNTMHKLFNEMMDSVSIEFVHIAEATAEVISGKNFKSPALLATKFTMEEDFYKDKLINWGLNVLIPNEQQRETLHKIIYEELCFNKINESSRDLFIEIVDSVKETGADSVILGCTEVGLLLNQNNSSLPVFDTVQIHCQKIINSASN
ncbi:MAG: aspartate racemase [Actinobacteria bacterium]|nr:aspartate racemase [Actinomycetota bacterium]